MWGAFYQRAGSQKSYQSRYALPPQPHQLHSDITSTKKRLRRGRKILPYRETILTIIQQFSRIKGKLYVLSKFLLTQTIHDILCNPLIPMVTLHQQTKSEPAGLTLGKKPPKPRGQVTSGLALLRIIHFVFILQRKILRHKPFRLTFFPKCVCNVNTR